ncbi:MAG TPA: hypothetical protein VN643_03180 [Pyrinomonadaceae bacterium]|nr:hypothetical protein [Pyrinomonadaceae bacterium]
MPKSDKDILPFADLPTGPSEPQGFSPDEMVRCEECLRANPPTRIVCLYCGVGLPASSAAAKPKPSLRPLEKWEQGYNNILIKVSGELKDDSIEEAAGFLRLQSGDLRRLVNSLTPLPLARTSVSEEANLIRETLASLGLVTIIVPDEFLRLEATPPIRLRTVELLQNELVAHPTSGDPQSLSWKDIVLLVSGRLFAAQVEVKERKRRGAERQILNAMHTSTDEEVLDIYTLDQNGGWRILSSNFDFSCLGAGKKLIAGENFAALKKLIVERSSEAQLIDSYDGVRRSLELAWPSEQQTSSLGWRRERAGRYSTSEVAVTSNESQFTRYSRLCHVLKINPITS